MSKFGQYESTLPGGTVLTQKVLGANPIEIEAAEQPQDIYYKEGVRKGTPTFEKHDRCYQCGFTYPESQFEYYQGKAYCIPGGCNNDIPQLRRK